MTRKRARKDRDHGAIRRRNPVAKALIEQAMAGRVVPGRKRYTRKVKHRKGATTEQE
ncbi:MAG TPA: hypothetical protein VFZ01_04285 [Geminicoccaceae bacterium]